MLYKDAVPVILTYGDKLSKEELELLLYRKHENINIIYGWSEENILHVLCHNKLVTLDMIKYIIEETDITNENINKINFWDKENILHILCDNESVTLPIIKYIIEETDFKIENVGQLDVCGKNAIYYLSDNKIEIKEYLLSI